MPLLQDDIAPNAMVCHTMEIIEKAHEDHEVPVIVADQPVYAIGKKIQWLYLDKYGEDKLLMLLGPLHIEMAFLNTIGDWLECSGWVDIIVKSEVNTLGRAEALLKGNHPQKIKICPSSNLCIFVDVVARVI